MLLMVAMLTNPYAIFANARSYWESATYPPEIAYTIIVKVAHKGVASAAHYHLYYDSWTNKVSVDAVSDEELAHPYTPHGINTFINLFGATIPTSAPQNTFDYLGVPVLAPNYGFGVGTYTPRTTPLSGMDLVNEIRREFHDPAPHRPAPDTGLKTIAAIEVVRRAYIITLAGLVQSGDHDDYDLVLTPVRDPAKYRLREAWINETTFATDKVVTQGNFTDPAFSGFRWTVVFQQIGSAPYIASETAGSGFVLDRRPYDSAQINFINIAAATTGMLFSESDFITNTSAVPSALTEP